MILARKLAERFFDFLGGGVASHAQRLVVVLEFHEQTPYSASLKLSEIAVARSGFKVLKAGCSILNCK